jgi:hypothetical protein
LLGHRVQVGADLLDHLRAILGSLRPRPAGGDDRELHAFVIETVRDSDGYAALFRDDGVGLERGLAHGMGALAQQH